MGFLNRIIGDGHQRQLKKIRPLVEQINQWEKRLAGFSLKQIQEQSQRLKETVAGLKNQQLEDKLNQILPEAFALVREAAKQTIGQRHYDVQLIGGIVLHQGKIAEMKTGEGKTLAATLAIYLNALAGQGVHIVTVNDYLARRDTNWMGPIYHLLGLSTACLNHEKSYLFEPQSAPDKNEVTIEMENLKEISRAEAYQADITYGTNNEFGFDYLRDNMALTKEAVVQRPPHYAIIDEVDSILIDEARTPLIISAPDQESTELYKTFNQLVPRLKKEIDYTIDEKMRAVSLTEEGINRVEKMLGLGNIYQEGGIRYVHHLEEALKAHILFKRDKDYVVKDNQVIIVDEFTGRLMPGRRFSGGLHQALEAKEGVTIQQESRTLASISFQNFFRRYPKLAGMTGTAATSAEEFHKVYNLEVVVVPTNKPMIRQDLTDRVYKTSAGKLKALVEEVKKRHQKGQPILIGTVSIEKNELLSAYLQKAGIRHQVLNAKNHEEEAQVIARAGRQGAVTVATNMAGRGVDIILGGRPEEFDQIDQWQKEHDQVVKLGGLHLIGTERHEARRIDDQLRGRAGRQGDPGSSQFFVSLEDDLMRIFGGERIRALMTTLKIPEDQPIEYRFIAKAIESAQAKIEGYHFDIRRHLLEYDDVINKQREVIYSKRQEVLRSPKLKKQILEMIKEEISQLVRFYTQAPHSTDWSYKEISQGIKSIFPAPIDLDEQLRKFSQPEAMIEYLNNLAQEAYEKKEKELSAKTMREVERFVLLRVIDTLWANHLETMDYLRDSVRLRAYGQKDPLVEYKNEGNRLFRKLLASIESSAVQMIYKVGLAQAPVQSPYLKKPEKKGQGKIGRNDPCPCGSGRKYKKCCGR